MFDWPTVVRVRNNVRFRRLRHHESQLSPKMSSFQDYIEYPTYDSTKAKVSTRSQEIQSHGSSSSGDDAHPTDRPERMREWIIR